MRAYCGQMYNKITQLPLSVCSSSYTKCFKDLKVHWLLLSVNSLWATTLSLWDNTLWKANFAQTTMLHRQYTPHNSPSAAYIVCKSKMLLPLFLSVPIGKEICYLECWLFMWRDVIKLSWMDDLPCDALLGHLWTSTLPPNPPYMTGSARWQVQNIFLDCQLIIKKKYIYCTYNSLKRNMHCKIHRKLSDHPLSKTGLSKRYHLQK